MFAFDNVFDHALKLFMKYIMFFIMYNASTLCTVPGAWHNESHNETHIFYRMCHRCLGRAHCALRIRPAVLPISRMRMLRIAALPIAHCALSLPFFLRIAGSGC